MYYIKNGFKNYKNDYFDNIREIHFDKFEDLIGNLGSFILETHSNEDLGFALNPGIYLYASEFENNKAYRIYKDYANYKYLCYTDDAFISKLQSIQKNIKLTNFPTGVVTLGGNIIGQEVPYYKETLNIDKYFIKYLTEKNVTKYYLKILYILKELFREGIIYKDINSGNFLVNINTERINLIDFDPVYTIFSGEKDYAYYEMIEHLKILIQKLNRIKCIKFNENFSKVITLEEIEESLLENQKRLIKKY